MLGELIKPENVYINLESSDKAELFAEMTEGLIALNPAVKRDQIIEGLVKREEQLNTCIMKGIAVPHCNLDCITDTLCLVGISRNGIDYGPMDGTYDESYDNSLVHLVVMFIFGKSDAQKHLDLLADCARLLHVPGFYKAITLAKSPQEACNIINEYETH